MGALNSRKLTALAVVATVFLGAVAWLVWSGALRLGGVNAVTDTAPPERDTERAPRARTRDDEARPLTPTGVDTSKRDLSTHEITGEAPSSPVVVRGRLLYRDSDRSPSTARFLLTCDTNDDDAPVEVVAVAGKFTARLPRAGPYAFEIVEVEGEPYPGWWSIEIIEIRDEEALALTLEEPRRPLLLAEEAGRGTPVRARAYLADAYSLDGPPTDEPDTDAAVFPKQRLLTKPSVDADALGRIVLPRGVGWAQWFVGADGYAWAIVRVDYRRTEPYRVQLRKGAGTLRVRVTGHVPGDRLRISGETGVPAVASVFVVDDVDAEGVYELHGAPPGNYSITLVAVRDRNDEPIQAHAQVVSDRVVEIELRGERRASAVRAHGTVSTGPDWAGANVSLWLTGDGQDQGYRSDTVSLDLTPNEHVPFELTVPRAGPYVVVIRARSSLMPDWHAAIDVPPDGWIGELRVLDPGRIRVKVLDADTGAPVRDADVTAMMEVTRGAGAPPAVWGAGIASVDEGVDVYLLPCQPGRWSVHVIAAGYAWSGTPVDVVSRESVDLTVRLPRQAIVRVRLVPGEASKRCRQIGVECLDAAGTGPGQSAGFDGPTIIEGLSPGVYSLLIRCDDDGRLLAARRLVLAAGDDVQVDIALD